MADRGWRGATDLHRDPRPRLREPIACDSSTDLHTPRQNGEEDRRRFARRRNRGADGRRLIYNYRSDLRAQAGCMTLD